MAKQKVNLRDTLQRNKQPTMELPAKVELKKTDKDLDKINEKVAQIHNKNNEIPLVEEAPLPFVMLVTEMKPNPFEGFDPDAPATEPEETQPSLSPTRLVRISLDTPKDVHLQLKIKAAKRGQTIREYQSKTSDVSETSDVCAYLTEKVALLQCLSLRYALKQKLPVWV